MTSARIEIRLSERTIRAGLWTIGARLASRVVDLLTLLVLARFLGPADFGLVASAMTVIFVVEAILEMPLAAALLLLPDTSTRPYQTAFTLGLIRGILIAAIIAALSLPIASFYGNDRLIPLICALALAPAIRGVVSPGMIVFEKAMDFRRRAVLELLGKGAAALVAITVAVTTGSYWAIAAGTIVAPTVMMVCSYVMAPMWPRLTLADWPLFSEIIGWNFATQTLNAVNWQIDRILLPRYTDATSFGQFTVAGDLASLPHQVIAVPAAGPLTSAFAAARENGTLKEVYLKSSASLFLMLTPILCFIAVLSGPIIRVLLGPQWQDAAPILTAMALLGLVSVPSVPMSHLAFVVGQSRNTTIRSFLELLVRVPLTLAGVLLFGIPGAIAAKAGSTLAVCTSTFFLTRSMTDVSIRDQMAVLVRPILSVLLACGVLFACTAYLDFEGNLYVSFLLSGVAYCLTYAVFVYVFWVMAGRPHGMEASIVRIIGTYIRRWTAA